MHCSVFTVSAFGRLDKPGNCLFCSLACLPATVLQGVRGQQLKRRITCHLYLFQGQARKVRPRLGAFLSSPFAHRQPLFLCCRWLGGAKGSDCLPPFPLHSSPPGATCARRYTCPINLPMPSLRDAEMGAWARDNLEARQLEQSGSAGAADQQAAVPQQPADAVELSAACCGCAPRPRKMQML